MKSFQGSYVYFDQHFDVFDILLKLIWYIFIFRIFIQCILFLSFHVHTTWSHTNKTVQQAVPLIATHINDNDINNDYKNERKSEQAHIPHAPTLLENAVYNEWQFQA